MPMLIGDVFRRNAEVVPDRIAASLGAAMLTHGELDRAGNRLCRALAELCVPRWDRVVSWAHKSLELFVTLARLGAVRPKASVAVVNPGSARIRSHRSQAPTGAR